MGREKERDRLRELEKEREARERSVMMSPEMLAADMPVVWDFQQFILSLLHFSVLLSFLQQNFILI